MTARVNSLFVILENDIRIDDIQSTIDAIKQIKRVLEVKTHISTPVDSVAESRVRNELGQKLMDVVYPPSQGRK